jgi:hypothetical protein
MPTGTPRRRPNTKQNGCENPSGFGCTLTLLYCTTCIRCNAVLDIRSAPQKHVHACVLLNGMASRTGAGQTPTTRRGGSAASAGGTRAAAGLGPRAASHPAGGSRPTMALCSGACRPSTGVSRAEAEQGARVAFRFWTSACQAAPDSRRLGKATNGRVEKLDCTRSFGSNPV